MRNICANKKQKYVCSKMMAGLIFFYTLYAYMHQSCQPRFNIKFLFRSLYNIIYAHKKTFNQLPFSIPFSITSLPRLAKTSHFLILLCMMPDDFTRQQRVSRWERYNWSYPLPPPPTPHRFALNLSLLDWPLY